MTKVSNLKFYQFYCIHQKIIQDAFMSRKKLTKEYKQLAIWSGDIEKEFSRKTDENATKSQVQDSHDSEWELL